jgi:hypothetical protein
VRSACRRWLQFASLRDPVRYLLLGVVLILSTAAPVRADSGLTAAVASTYFPRTVDEGLHSIAHARVEELRACRCLNHDGMRSGTAEVLYSATGMPNPILSAVSQWASSPLHNGILSDSSYGRIGCAEAVEGDTHYLACVLAAGPLPAGSGSGGGTTFVLPDTAIGRPSALAPIGAGGARPI